MYTFVDLFAGIGGFRVACSGLFNCVYSSEIDTHTQTTYEFNFKERPYGDITVKENRDEIPDDFDLLTAGFPCQPFSVTGRMKGFKDKRGLLIFDILEIAKKHKPKVLLLENVKHIVNHNNSETFTVIENSIKQAGYTVFYKLMNATDYGNIPQNRERLFIVAIRKDIHVPFSFPDKIKLTTSIIDCLEDGKPDDKYYYDSRRWFYSELDKGVVDNKSVWQWRRSYLRKSKYGICPTLTANMGTGGNNVPLLRDDYGIRKLTPKECLNLSGFPEEYNFPDTIPLSAKYKQVGNTIIVPVVRRLAEHIHGLLVINDFTNRFGDWS